MKNIRTIHSSKVNVLIARLYIMGFYYPNRPKRHSVLQVGQYAPTYYLIEVLRKRINNPSVPRTNEYF